ncbi:hypothetical protein ABK045_20385 [Stenotrophomonas pavanii]|uniref:hypothetical protein n=1 Tax=Stenotrophomonas TaxID=40323 RepID=UPI0021C909F9|nr:hypothetical protein [Stenotrophomonas sp. Sm5341]MCU1123568.1 hypothetical protein [Stenotrophomonas maltophilia]MDQ7285867.1 hypothetical protein [Stenotrophomonas sp. Sm5341]
MTIESEKNAPTARATLADVQPGGRVRLGDQTERARFEEWAQVGLERDTTGEYTSRITQMAWTAWQAAFSAQPSQSSSIDLEAMLAACVPGGDMADPQVIADNIRHWFAAQPFPGGQEDDSDLLAELRDVEDYFEDVDPNPIHLATVRAAIEALAARQPVGEPVVISKGARECLQEIIDNCWRDEDQAVASEIGRLMQGPLYTAPPALPAQAVDLGPGLDAAASLIQKKADDYADEFGYDDMGALSFGRGHHAEVKSAHHFFMLELVDELRALIDSQAVRNG